VREFSTDALLITRMELSPDGKLLALLGKTADMVGNGRVAWGPDGVIRVWDVALGKEIRQLSRAGFGEFHFAPDGKSIAACGLRSALYLWDPLTGKEVRQIPLDCPTAWGLAFSRDGKLLATAAGGSTIRLFDPTSGKDLAPPGEIQTGLWRLAFSGNGKKLLSVSEKGIHAWDPRSGRLGYRFQTTTEMPAPPFLGRSVDAIAVARDGGSLFSATSRDKTITAWDLENGRKLREFPVDDLSASPCLAVAPDGKTIALSTKGSLLVVDAMTGKRLKELDQAIGDGSGLFVDGGKKLLMCSMDHKWHLWDVGSGRKLFQHSFPYDRGPSQGPNPGAQGWPAYTMAVSPDNRLIAYGSQDKFLAVFELASGREVARLDDLPDGVSALVFSPSARTLVWSGWGDGPIHVIETASGKERHIFHGHKGRVYALAFSPDGALLASASADITALVWDVADRPENRKTPLSTQQILACWDDLAADDAAPAYKAILKMASDPPRSVPFFAKNLQTVPAITDKVLGRLILNLGSDVFKVRDQAARELERLGEVAEPACREALGRPGSLELRRRLESLAEKYKQQARNPTPEFLRSLRAIECLELAGTAEARNVLMTISRGASRARLTLDAKSALERLSLAE
jgi:WD40 repeat protein